MILVMVCVGTLLEPSRTDWSLIRPTSEAQEILFRSDHNSYHSL